MQVFDLKFDSGLGEVGADMEKGSIAIVLTEKNPLFPSSGQINVPFNPILDAISAETSNTLVKWAIGILKWYLS